jgi:hypothetical protein
MEIENALHQDGAPELLDHEKNQKNYKYKEIILILIYIRR